VLFRSVIIFSERAVEPKIFQCKEDAFSNLGVER